MKLAEALAMRSDASKRFEQLRSRAQANARYQEGEPPAEDAGELLAEADRVLAELEDLIRRINRTNAATMLALTPPPHPMLEEQMTVTDAIARRDVLRWRHSLYTSVADAASGGSGPGLVRQMRSELRYVSAVTVSELRTAADEAARQHRELDVRIQQANWETDLMD
jgi:uncharacterized protein DUF6847